jgi:hypothetical protein
VALVLPFRKSGADQPSRPSSTQKSASDLKKDLGISIKPDVNDLLYSISGDKTVVAFSSASLIAAAKKSGGDCTAASAPLGRYQKVFKKDLITNADPGPWWLRKDELTLLSQGGHPVAVDLGDFYLVYVGPQSPCSSSESVGALQSAQTQDVGDALKTVTKT